MNQINETTVSEQVLKAIETAYKMSLASAENDEQKKGIDNFYHIHLNSLWYMIPKWEKEAK